MFTAGGSPPISQAKEKNNKFNNGGSNKWLKVLAGEDLPTKRRKSENSRLEGDNKKPRSKENIA